MKNNISTFDAEQAREAFDQLQEKYNDLVHLIKMNLEPHERERFKYNTLAHAQPGLFNEHDWVMGSEVKGLEFYVEEMEAISSGKSEDEDEREEDDGKGNRVQ